MVLLVQKIVVETARCGRVLALEQPEPGYDPARGPFTALIAPRDIRRQQVARYIAILELERLQVARKARADSASSMDAERLRHPLNPTKGELGKQGGNNPGADANPPEDQEDTVERVEVS